MLLLHRARTLETVRNSYPETNEKVLRFQGGVITFFCFFGDLFEGIGGVLYNGNFFHQSTHQALYTIFILPSAAMILESHARLPLDTSRKLFSISFLCEAILFFLHGLMQAGSEKIFHMTLASIALVTSLSLIYSVLHPRSVFIQITIQSLLVLQALWFYTIALTFIPIPITVMQIGPILVFQIFVISFLILLISSKVRDPTTPSSITYAHQLRPKKVLKKGGDSILSQTEYEVVDQGHVRIKSEDGLI